MGPTTARAFVWALRARRPPWADETGGRQEGVRAAAGAGNPEPASALRGRGSRDPRWQCSAASEGFRRESNLSGEQGGRDLYKTKAPGVFVAWMYPGKIRV